MNQTWLGIDTSYGRITLRLERERLPVTVTNFLGYVDDGFYDNTLFHRVIDNFIIQGGGFEPGLIQKITRAPIANESSAGLSNKRGTIAMARLPDDPDSATAQFFINTRDNDILDHSSTTTRARAGYCAFGEVVDGMEVVERIEGVSTTTVGEHRDVPAREIVIERIHRMRVP